MITETQAAQALKYLIAAGAMTAIDDQPAVWADYINHEAPATQVRDLLPAARLCLKRWADDHRRWKVDLPRYVQSINRVRSKRVSDAIGDKPLYPDMDLRGRDYLDWVQTARKCVADGMSRAEAEKVANSQAVRSAQTLSLPHDTNENPL